MVEPAKTGLLGALTQALTDHMVNELPTAPAGQAVPDFRSLHHTYASWRLRFPPPRPRLVHLSTELRQSAAFREYEKALDTLVTELEAGQDIGPRLSTNVRFAVKPDKGGARHLDRLLADWGFHHLHLGTGTMANGFKERTGRVVVAAFKPDDVYLVDLVEHESDGDNWAARSLLETVVHNWPDGGLVTASRTALSIVGGNVSDEVRKTQRAANIATGMIEVDGKVWLSMAFGQTGGGTPGTVAIHGMGLLWWLSNENGEEARLAADLSALADEYTIPDTWTPWVNGEHFGFRSGPWSFPCGSLVPR